MAESTKDEIRSRVASTVQSASIRENNLTREEQRALKRLKNNDIVILPPDKGHVIVVMDKTDYNHKMDTLVNDKHTYELLIQDPTPSLQRKLNSKMFSMRKANMINLQTYYRLRSSVARPSKLYGLPKLHKPQIPMRPIVSFYGSPIYKLSKHLTTILQLLTNKSQHKLYESTENFIDAMNTVKITDDYKLVSFDVQSENQTCCKNTHFCPLYQHANRVQHGFSVL